MLKEALPAGTGSTQKVGTLQIIGSQYPYLNIVFSHEQARGVLEIVKNRPGSALVEIQHGLGYSRGNPRTKEARRQVSQIVYLFETLGLVRKDGHRFSLTRKGEGYVPTMWVA